MAVKFELLALYILSNLFTTKLLDAQPLGFIIKYKPHILSFPATVPCFKLLIEFRCVENDRGYK